MRSSITSVEYPGYMGDPYSFEVTNKNGDIRKFGGIRPLNYLIARDPRFIAVVQFRNIIEVWEITTPAHIEVLTKLLDQREIGIYHIRLFTDYPR